MTDVDYLRNHLTEGQMWGQLAEEAAELAQAALKMQRICDKTNPPRKTEEECRQAVIEEKADVEGCFTVLAWYPSTEQDEIIAAKLQRWRKHLEGKP